MSESSKPRKDGRLMAILGQLSNQGFALFSMLILLRLLSKEDYGMWALYLTVLSMAEMARAGFVQNGLVSFVQSHPGEDRQIIGASYALNLGLGILLWGSLILLSYPLGRIWSAPAFPELTMWYGLFMLTLGGLRFLEYVQIARQDFKGVLIGNSLYGGIQCLVLASWWAMGYQPALRELIWLQAGAAATGFAAVWLSRRRLFVWALPTWDWVKKLANYGRFVLGTNLGSMLLQRVDVMLIGYFMGPVAVAPYNVALRMTSYLEIPLRGLATAVFPRISQAWAREGAGPVARLHEKTVADMLALTLPGCLILWVAAPWAVQIMAGPGYEEAVGLLRILLVFALAKPWGRMFGTTMDAIGKPNINFRYVLVGLVINTLLSAMMIPWLGLEGAAYAMVLGMALLVALNHWQLRRFMPVRAWQVVADLGIAYRYLYARLRQRLAL